jgi:hypothetical protein
MNEPIIDKRRPIHSKRKFRERRAGKEMEFEGRCIDLDRFLKMVWEKVRLPQRTIQDHGSLSAVFLKERVARATTLRSAATSRSLESQGSV